MLQSRVNKTHQVQWKSKNLQKIFLRFYKKRFKKKTNIFFLHNPHKNPQWQIAWIFVRISVQFIVDLLWKFSAANLSCVHLFTPCGIKLLKAFAFVATTPLSSPVTVHRQCTLMMTSTEGPQGMGISCRRFLLPPSPKATERFREQKDMAEFITEKLQ